MNNNVLLWLLASNAAKETNEADYVTILQSLDCLWHDAPKPYSMSN